MIVRSIAISLALIVVLRVSPLAWGGELFDSSQGKDHDPNEKIGRKSLMDAMDVLVATREAEARFGMERG